MLRSPAPLQFSVPARYCGSFRAALIIHQVSTRLQQSCATELMVLWQGKCPDEPWFLETTPVLPYPTASNVGSQALCVALGSYRGSL